MSGKKNGMPRGFYSEPTINQSKVTGTPSVEEMATLNLPCSLFVTTNCFEVRVVGVRKMREELDATLL